MPLSHPPDRRPAGRDEVALNPVFTREPVHVPRRRLPTGELDADTAFQLVHDELMLDGNSRLNLATFVTTWMEPRAAQLMADCADKYMIDRFANYRDVEARLVPMAGDRFHLSAEEAVRHCDENTIGVVAVLGSTFGGSYEPVAEICAALDRLQTDRGLDVPVHVDGASGAMVAPFCDPGLVWDFRLPRVASIDTSGHKYGLVYPGVGWAIWRDIAALPDDLVFRVNYLGGEMPTFALNFFRPGAQYYQFLRLGTGGYRRVQSYARDVATGMAARIARLGPFRLLTDGSQLPVFACTLTTDGVPYSVFDVSAALRERGWLVPAYTFPADREDLAVLRIVVRNGFTHDLADLFLADLRQALTHLDRQDRPQRGAEAASFSHGAAPRRSP